MKFPAVVPISRCIGIGELYLAKKIVHALGRVQSLEGTAAKRLPDTIPHLKLIAPS